MRFWKCGCDPDGTVRCPDGARFEGGPLGASHFQQARVALGRAPIESWQDVPQTPRARYEIDLRWRSLEEQIRDYEQNEGLDMSPDFQRGHVWSEAQRVAYLEAALTGMEVSRQILFNHTSWEFGGDFPRPFGTMQILDGLQRVETVRRFLRGEVRVFGRTYPEFSGVLRDQMSSFKIRILNLPDRAAVLQLYLQINSGGTPHSASELARVRSLLAGG